MDIKKNLLAVAKAFNAFKAQYKSGVDCFTLFENFTAVLDAELKDYQIKYDYICGKDTLNVDGVTKDYVLQNGDTVIMDISVGFDGVWCDVTRTFFVGGYSKEQERIFNLIVTSLKNGGKALKHGAFAKDIYNAVNKVFVLDGKTLIHHAGHKIGQSCLMQPQFLPDNDGKVFDGDLVAIESGLYQRFGIRLENDYLIKNDGAIDLFIDLMPLDIKEYVLK